MNGEQKRRIEYMIITDELVNRMVDLMVAQVFVHRNSQTCLFWINRDEKDFFVSYKKESDVESDVEDRPSDVCIFIYEFNPRSEINTFLVDYDGNDKKKDFRAYLLDRNQLKRGRLNAEFFLKNFDSPERG
jgi:hypothetical protein